MNTETMVNTTKTTLVKGDEMMSARRKRLPKRLKKYRMDAGYSIYTLSDKLGVNYSTISHWENGKKFPRQQSLMKLEDIFGVSYRELFEDLTEEEADELERRLQEQIRNPRKNRY